MRPRARGEQGVLWVVRGIGWKGLGYAGKKPKQKKRHSRHLADFVSMQGIVCQLIAVAVEECVNVCIDVTAAQG